MPKNKSIAMVGMTLAVVLLALVVGSGGAFAQSIMGGVIQCQDRPPASPPETARCSSSA